MIKELTVAEISEALGYEVKVVKEQPTPYQFKAGDVVECEYYKGNARIRLIVELQCGEGLIAVDIQGEYRGISNRYNFRMCGYKKIGELKAFLVK